MTGSIIATAIPQITTHFKSLEDIGWYGSASLVTTCCLQPFVGKIYTHFPTKHTFIIFMIIFTIGSIICGMASSSKILIGGRAVQGAGAAGLLNGAFTVIAAVAPPDKKPMFTGVGMALSTVGQVIGPTIGGALTERVSWRWCFYINLPFSGLVLLVLCTLSIPEQTEKKPVRSTWRATVKEELDLLGFALFAPACVMFLLAIIWGGNKFAWRSSAIIGLFCGAAATTIVFVLRETRRGEKAMIPPSIIRKQLVIFGCITNLLGMASNLTLAYYLPLWFQVVKGESPLMSGVMVLPTAIAQSIGAVLAGKFVQVLRYCAPWAMFGSMISSIGSGLMTTFVPSTGAGAWIGYQILVGLGRASVMQIPIIAIQGFLPPKEQAMATSQVFFFQYLGGTVFLAVAETIFTSALRSGLRDDAPNVNAELIINAGATAVRSVLSEANLPGVLRAYNHAIICTFNLAVAGTSAAFFACIGLGWKPLPHKATEKRTEKDVEGLKRTECNSLAAA
ncbi:DNA repair protein RAD50 [Exophiala viscosa]|uniref:DNA repair protein RAD50 n=1 Tax=Exophiala viscosa TaxID=2486360 RepID=A0AAN6E437_9EURO|nr:DNA repair protein RAD50 [Exophiala viscosa]KAI1626581.1 DNA repair protein RAD50 [Exophiala viscosa]